MRDYSRVQLYADSLAGITVGMVAIPLSIAIAIASGADPAKALITAIVGGFLISLIGGATGAFIVVVYGVIVAHGYDGLVLATFMAGLILLAAGFPRAGNLVTYVPEPVIDGFAFGISVIIATSQIKDLAGLTTGDLPADFGAKIAALWAARATVSGASLAIGAGTVAAIVALRRLVPRFPGQILAVAAASAAVAMLGLHVDTIRSRFGALPHGLPVPALPEISYGRIKELLPSAFIIAFLAGVESLLSAMVADRMIAGRHRSNAEVLAQGAANLGSSLFGGMPAIGAIARTATNVRAGGRTPVAGLVHAVTILVVVMVAAPLAGCMALPVLAGLLILTAWAMSEPHKWRGYLGLRRADQFLLVLTPVLTVVADLTVAIGTGVAIGLAIRLRRRHVPPAEWQPPER